MKIYLSFQFNLLVILFFCFISCKQSIINKEQLNVKEYFTSNIDLAYKRADVGTDIRIKTIKNNY